MLASNRHKKRSTNYLFLLRKSVCGFTIIELLAVVAIIGLMASIIIATVNSGRIRARNTQRKADLKQLQVYLELYRDANGAYPCTATNCTGSPVWFSSDPLDQSFNNNNGNWIPGLAPTYIGALPSDPLGGPSTICGGVYRSAYLYRSDNGTEYTLLSHCAPEGTWVCNNPSQAANPNDAFCDISRPTWAFKVCSPGGCGL